MSIEVIDSVDCSWCFDWTEERRKEVDCFQCSNTRKVPNPQKMLCNVCGDCTRLLGSFTEQSPRGLENLEVVGGYFSHHLFDLRSYKFSICEKCLRNLFNQCKIPPIVHDVYLNDDTRDPIPYDKDKESYDYRIWCDEGGHHQAYVNRKCNFIKDCPNNAIYTRFISDHFTEECSCEEHKDLGKNCTNCKLVTFIPNVLKPFL